MTPIIIGLAMQRATSSSAIPWARPRLRSSS